MTDRAEAVNIINELSEARYIYVLDMLRDIAFSEKKEKEEKSEKAFR